MQLYISKKYKPNTSCTAHTLARTATNRLESSTILKGEFFCMYYTSKSFGSEQVSFRHVRPDRLLYMSIPAIRHSDGHLCPRAPWKSYDSLNRVSHRALVFRKNRKVRDHLERSVDRRKCYYCMCSNRKTASQNSIGSIFCLELFWEF